MEQSLLSIKKLNVKYGKVTALENINLEIGFGEIVSVIGPNGSGKSTLIKAILGLAKKEKESEILIEGKPSIFNLNKISYMPQSEEVDKTFPISVREVVMQSQYNRASSKSEKLVNDAIELNDLTELQNRSLNELSGGQIQRAFLSRALAQDGDLILLDEPFSNMDITTQHKVIEILNHLKEEGKTIIITTHNLKLAQEISTKILLLNKHVVCFGNATSVYDHEHLIQTFGEDIMIVKGEKISISDHHAH